MSFTSARFNSSPARCQSGDLPAVSGLLRAVLAAAAEDSSLSFAGLVPVWGQDDAAVAAAAVLRVSALAGLRFVLGNGSDPDLLAEAQDLAAILRAAAGREAAPVLFVEDCLAAAALLSAAVYALSRIGELKRPGAAGLSAAECIASGRPADVAVVLRHSLAAAGVDTVRAAGAGQAVPSWPAKEAGLVALCVLAVEAAFGVRYVLGSLMVAESLEDARKLAAILRWAAFLRPEGELLGVDCRRAADLLARSAWAISTAGEAA